MITPLTPTQMNVIKALHSTAKSLTGGEEDGPEETWADQKRFNAAFWYAALESVPALVDDRERCAKWVERGFEKSMVVQDVLDAIRNGLPVPEN